MTDYLIFTDNWWNWFFHEYAFTILVLYALLKCLAMCDPSNKSDTILEAFRSMLSTGQGMNRRATDPADQIKPK